MSGEFGAWAGSKAPKIVIVGEAWGQTEALLKKPFVGSSGQELFAMLGEAMPLCEPELHARIVAKMRYGNDWVGWREEWLRAAGIAYTNVFNLRPPDNKMEALCVKKAELGDGPYPFPALANPGKYIKHEFLPEVYRLWSELVTVKPNLIIAAGNTACWAVLGQTNISAIRGNAGLSRDLGGGLRIKTLPTYHPAGVMRQWAWRPIVIGDLMKAAREAEFPEMRRPNREILIDPTLAEIEQWVKQTLANPPELLSCDTETSGGQISMIGFGRSRSEALLVPFVDKAKPGASYWPDAWSEIKARELCDELLASEIPKLFQNGAYDFQYMSKEGFRMRNLREDSMLLHHSILPEMRKGLGFLGSVYTSEPVWKTMRLETPDTEKRDE